MALLKLSVTIMLMAVTLTLSGQNQSFEKQKSAFRNSYVAEKEGRFEAAAKHLLDIYSESSYEINLRLGWLYYQMGNYPASANYYRKSITLMPFGLEARFGLTYPLVLLGNANELIEVYNDILEIDPSNSIALYRYGLFLYEREDYQKADKMLTKVVNLYPFDYDGLNLLAWTKLRLGKTLESKALFQKALLNKPEDESANLGISYIK